MKKITLPLLLVGLLFSCTKPKNQQHIDTIKAVDQWLKDVKVTSEGVSIWPDVLDEPEKVSLSLSDGVAGKLAFYLQLHKETDNERYLAEVKLAADYILAHLPSKTDSLQSVFWAFSPYGIVCGPSFALIETYKATGEEKYRAGAEEIIDVIHHFAINREDTLSWGLGNDVLGGLAGTALFMLYAGETLERPDLIATAEKAAGTLISRANNEAGLSWKRGQNGRFTLPNFSHGAAGIGYFLARLYETTQDPKHLEAALKANVYLESIAKTDGGVFLVPYGFPDPGWSRPFDIGWAHGPAGVARFYHQLYKVTGDMKWQEREKACLRGIVASGIPGIPKNGDFGVEEFYLDNRFGIASVASFMLDLQSSNEGDQKLLEELIDHVISKGITQNQKLFWPQARYNFMAKAGDTTAFTGYFYGASGYGMLLLKAQAKLNGTDFIRFVDDPY
ncbi:MAG: lanthionine synthetase LanC family protein [Cyclobacteriaceae bacterium]